MKRSQTSLIAFVGLTLVGLLATVVAGWHPSLGLDLQGGASVVLQPDRKVSNELLDQTISIIRSRVDALGVAEPEITRQGNAIVVQLPGVKDTKRALAIVGQTAELRFRPVLADLPSEAATAEQAAAAKTSTTTTAKPGTVSSKIVTITAPPNATTSGAPTSTTAVVSTTVASAAASTKSPPATAAPGTAENVALGGGGRFGAARVAVQATATTIATTLATPNPTTTAAATSVSTKLASPTTPPTTPLIDFSSVTTAPPLSLPKDLSKTTPIEEDDKTKSVILPLDKRDPSSPRLLLGPAELTGDVVSDAFVDVDQSGNYVTILKLNSKGSAQWDALANKYYQQRIAVVLDGVVKSAPTIQARSFGGTASISGAKTSQEAKDLATALRYGSLPVQLKPATVQTVSASLGRDSLRAGLLTGGVGLLLVAAYMVFYYRRLGLVVIAGLCMSASLMWILVSWLSEQRGLALSLSGAVGIIVAVGITVDSYVVYFERIRDENRAGRSIAGSVDRAFKSAWRTILAADLTSLIGAGALYFLTVGSVRGFAFFLALSTMLDMLVAYFFTRTLVSILGRRGWFGGGSIVSGGPGIPESGGGGRLRPSVKNPAPAIVSNSNAVNSTVGVQS